MHILVVEDDALISKVLTTTLERAGYQVTAIMDGSEAWTALQKQSFDLLLLDRQLPGIDGLSLLKQIKQTPSMKHLPVVMETGMDDEASIQEGINAGAYYYLTKPVHHELLQTVVSRALAQLQQSRALQESLESYADTLGFLCSGRFECRTLDEARHLAQGLARAFPEPERAVFGLTEMLVNAVEHGNLAITYAEKSEYLMSGSLFAEVERRLEIPPFDSRRVRVDLTREPDRVSACITDEGDGFDWEGYLDLSPERAFDPHGRGIALSRQSSFDEVSYSGIGNVVTVSMKRTPA